MLYSIPNILTLIRIALIPIFMLVFFLPYSWVNWASAIIFSVAAITDWFDGYLARKLNQVSSLGAFLDPVADKLMVAVALVSLVVTNPNPWFAVPAAIIIGREITISALREWMAGIGQRRKVAVSQVGKFKTAAQMIAIILLLIREDVGPLPIYDIGMISLYLASVLTIWSMLVYLRAAYDELVKDKP